MLRVGSIVIRVDDLPRQTAFWTAALVKYVRCFTSGKRFGLNENIFLGIEGDPVGAHRFFKNMRDKHVAHSVNPFEEVRVGAVLSPEGTQPQVVQGISAISRKLICTDVEGVRTLGQLASVIHKKVCDSAAKAQTELLEWAKKQGQRVSRWDLWVW